MDVQAKRPGTVNALVVLSGLGAGSALTLSDGPLWQGALAGAAGVLITYGLWAGASWAFSVSFMLSVACAALLALIVALQVFLFGGSPTGALLLPLAMSAVWIVLLTRPATRSFAARGGTLG
jgi:hypothetical protein